MEYLSHAQKPRSVRLEPLFVPELKELAQTFESALKANFKLVSYKYQRYYFKIDQHWVKVGGTTNIEINLKKISKIIS